MSTGTQGCGSQVAGEGGGPVTQRDGRPGAGAGLEPSMPMAARRAICNTHHSPAEKRESRSHAPSSTRSAS